ncbi:MAG: tetratricopeptide repeat protein [Bacteroidales bacterium]|nr:tetratricopeptide repeat protein [Bacteroidales bacterium]
MLKRFSFVCLFVCLIFSYSYAVKVDSLLRVIIQHKDDSVSLLAYEELLNALYDRNDKLYIKFAKEALNRSKNQKNEKFAAKYSLVLAEKYEYMGEFKKAIDYYNEALNYYQNLDSIKNIADVKNSIGRVYEKTSDYDKALSYYIESLKIREKIKDKKGIASSYNSIGLIYYYQGNYGMALKNFLHSLSLVKELNNPMGLATVYNNLGLIYSASDLNKKKYDSALIYFNLSLKFYEELASQYGISTSYLNIANCYYGKKDFTTAEKYYLKSIEIKKEIDDKIGLVSTYTSLAVLYQKKKMYQLAIESALNAVKLANELGNKEGLIRAYDVLSELYADMGNYKQAYEAFRKYQAMSEKLFNENSAKIVAKLQEQFQAEKREKDIQIANSKIKQQSILIYAAIIVILLILSLSVVILRSYREKKRANILLSEQNEEITHQKNIIEQKNQDILASITYAKRIQEAILPLPQYMNKYLKEMFVFYKPKDIVSGDFYWFMPVGDTILFAVVDCTGHGVPGAFMSIVGYNSLNQVIKEYNIIEPGEILDKLNILVQQALHTSEQEIKDGMDIALCALNTKTRMLKYAGANNPLYVIREKNKNNEFIVNKFEESDTHILFEIKGDSQPIGAFISHKNFTCNEIQLEPEDTLYIFSDGYADQFGGEHGKKLKYKPFKKMLLSVQTYSMEEQKKHLHFYFDNWKGSFEQIDDICVMGVRINN